MGARLRLPQRSDSLDGQAYIRVSRASGSVKARGFESLSDHQTLRQRYDH